MPGHLIRALIFLLGLAAALTAHASEETPVTIRAMRDEIAREIKELSLPGVEHPYFLEYTLLDEEDLKIKASFGALLDVSSEKTRYLQVGVRVGDKDFDQSNFGSDFSGVYTIAFEDDYDALRHELWLVTDLIYKDAVEVLAKKRAYLASKVKKEKTLPSFSDAPIQKRYLSQKPAPPEPERYKKLLRELSAIFKEYPDITDSRLDFFFTTHVRTYVNSEGTEIQTPRVILRLFVQAEARTEDGSKVRNQLSLFADAPETFPSQEELTARVRALADELVALKDAPVLEEDYIGPILFEGEAAGQVFREILADRFSGSPPLLGEGLESQPGGRKNFSNKIGRKVLPKILSVEDDPAQRSWEGVPLLGYYELDEEGVPGNKVLLVEKGILKNLLASRTPSEATPESNGHGRGSMLYKPRARISNLLIKAERGLSEKELRRKAIKLAKEAGLPYLLVVKRLEEPGTYDPDQSESFGESGALLTPLLAYKLYPDGRSSLVRGFRLAEVDLRALMQLHAAGKEQTVYSYLSGGTSGSSIFGFIVDPGRERAAYEIPTSIIAPSLLLEEAEARISQPSTRKPPLLPHPYFEGRGDAVLGDRK